tara:strand:- start:303 stop:563 length:261 start_codon:yes stop_codon:yes gene_type:complete
MDKTINNNQQKIFDLALEIVEKGMSIPAIFFLESTKYMSFLGNQMLIFIGPIATCFINNSKYYNFAEILEDRRNIELLISEIEKLN